MKCKWSLRLGAAVLCAVLLGVYYIIWRFITPESCLPF